MWAGEIHFKYWIVIVTNNYKVVAAHFYILLKHWHQYIFYFFLKNVYFIFQKIIILGYSNSLPFQKQKETTWWTDFDLIKVNTFIELLVKYSNLKERWKETGPIWFKTKDIWFNCCWIETKLTLFLLFCALNKLKFYQPIYNNYKAIILIDKIKFYQVLWVWKIIIWKEMCCQTGQNAIFYLKMFTNARYHPFDFLNNIQQF